MTNVTFKLYSDGGHCWLAVKRKLLSDFGIADKISGCSFQRGHTVYLENNYDAPKLVNAMAQKGYVISYRHRQIDRRSPIRSYEYYKV